MAFDWREYLNLARSLSGQSGVTYAPEAAHRSAVSRAYYAAFCHARNYAEAHLGFVPSKQYEDHGRLRHHLEQQRMAGPARELDRLRQSRNRCDYDEQVRGLAGLVTSAIEQADSVIKRLT